LTPIIISEDEGDESVLFLDSTEYDGTFEFLSHTRKTFHFFFSSAEIEISRFETQQKDIRYNNMMRRGKKVAKKKIDKSVLLKFSTISSAVCSFLGVGF
jgi:hypothetical protein